MVPLSRRTSTDVVVIGAGLAGLNAALHLQEGGARVQVLEARDQVGGRVHSMRQLGHSQEAGGTYIGAGYDRITSVCARVGIELVDVSPMLAFFREQDLVLGGELIRQSEWPEHPRNVFPDTFKDQMPWTLHRTLAVQDNPLPGPERWLDPEFAAYDVPVRSWLMGLGLDESAVRLAYDLNPSFGDHAGDVSALLLFFRAAFSTAQRGPLQTASSDTRSRMACSEFRRQWRSSWNATFTSAGSSPQSPPTGMVRKFTVREATSTRRPTSSAHYRSACFGTCQSIRRRQDCKGRLSAPWNRSRSRRCTLGTGLAFGTRTAMQQASLPTGPRAWLQRPVMAIIQRKSPALRPGSWDPTRGCSIRYRNRMQFAQSWTALNRTTVRHGTARVPGTKGMGPRPLRAWRLDLF